MTVFTKAPIVHIPLDMYFSLSYKKFKMWRYGLSEEEFLAMVETQQGKCYLCGNTPKVLCVDHNHHTNSVRKLLCRQCNSVLGLIKEDITILQNMILYLEKHNGN